MGTPRYAVNCSIMMKDRPPEERLAAVREAGFEAVEFWWPFAEPVPAEAEVESFVDTVRASGLRLVGLNLFAGDMPGGDRGVVSWPDRAEELRANAAVVRRIGEALGCRSFNALYGNRRSDVSDAEQDAAAVRVLGEVAGTLAEIGGTVLIEPVSGAPSYPLLTADDAVAVIERVERETGADNLGLLFDVYHLAVNGDDVPAALARHRGRVGHVQVADAPGRGAPGTGGLPLRDWVRDLAGGGYDGWTALEHAGDGPHPFGWTRSSDLPGLPGEAA
ncbi:MULTISPECIES: hydroxypyruvate isomerase family protein [Nocardiopsis]|uniref:Xylose isomerase domain protein TIM barrel n=1 Tax=Nocardiopsis dassonvillei (strain ATCC 23218 / DSM 43111 / CIP 107115 / JCM 7437 / KCTC 9190 / NBRC 14626 / NCTC 10488 / NRRL B-5397 / IMRU 509) TaxID=446468 RepID=D7AXC7_NOCDD|nr:TIM barrel protein [Nocardiopsis dassonvillei]ADH66001.1 Xylose isomerase domain protein TIM barrel [Nocardiopsis dassonvillei subsp. dassonvillei DSM 43111]VEI92022.1 Hydroxypyruvate isomerase [Nocardiopsis dassonvillei]